MKLRTAELKQKELASAQERETLERLREELDREKERLSSAALRLKTRAQEVEAFSKVISHYADPCMLFSIQLAIFGPTSRFSQLATEKYEEGEQALHNAKLVEAEHEARLRNLHTRTEHLRQQEQRILKVCVCHVRLLLYEAHKW